MKTFLEIMKYASGLLTAFGFAYAVGMIVADNSYMDALGEAYYTVSVIGLWDVMGILVIGGVLTILFVILEAVFDAGWKHASGGNKDE